LALVSRNGSSYSAANACASSFDTSRSDWSSFRNRRLSGMRRVS
jgi:hypothetical protein